MRRLARDTMTARERIEATLRGELPDRVPIFDLIQNIPLIEHVTGERLTTAMTMGSRAPAAHQTCSFM